MLVALRIDDFILIDKLELRLAPGYNVLTGETGAGKSIIVGALNLVLGGRANAEMVRAGAAQAEVEALFDVSHSEALSDRLDQAGLSSDGELVIRRVVQAEGRSRAYLNGRLCTARELSELSPELADVTSQHESTAIADPRRHMEYLDRFGGLTARRDELAQHVDDLLGLVADIDAASERQRSRVQREGFVGYQLEAIEAVSPEPGELDALQAERSRLRHADKLATVTAQAAQRLDRSDDALCDELGRLAAELTAAAELDDTLSRTATEVDESWTRLRESAAELAHYAERVEADPARLEFVQERIYRLEALLRQHGPQIEHVLQARERLQKELTELREAQTRLPELQRRKEKLLGQAARAARRLSSRRHKAAQTLGKAITSELAALGMGHGRVLVEITPAASRGEELTVDDARLGREGIDRVQFLIAPNKGSKPRPLGRIASGGELSRALLALKRALGGYACAANPKQRGTGIQVFDEVDAGVGGRAADRIGRSIADIARFRQVLCVTHLAPLAAYADTHFVVSKHERSTATISRIEQVNGPDRVAELARMLTGENGSQPATEAAKELLTQARQSGATIG